MEKQMESLEIRVTAIMVRAIVRVLIARAIVIVIVY